MHSSNRHRTAAILILTVSLATLLITASVSAQSFRGSIRGTVTDSTGSVLVGAKVRAKNINTGLERETTTGPDGAYVLAELPAGEYSVTAESPSLAPATQKIQVNVGLDTSANFELGKVQKQVEMMIVTAEAPLVEESRDVLGEVVDRQLVADLPLNGRDFGKLVALVPGATVEPSGVAAIQSGFGQFAINGNRDRSNNYTLDGTDNNDPFFNNSAMNQTGIGGAPASLLPIDAIQEFNLQSNFPAEYGRNTGSVVNIVTRSGTNHLHGSVFEFLRNDAMDARNYFNRSVDPSTGLPVQKTAFRNNQFGAALGGPIIKDKTFFFGAYEGQRERVGSDFSLLVPTQQQIAQAEVDVGGTVNPALVSILNYFFPNVPSAPPGASSALVPYSVKDKNDVNSLIAKVDRSFSASETLSARYAFAQSKQIFPLGNPGTLSASRLSNFAQNSPTRVQLFSGSLLSILGTAKVNEVRFGYSRYRTSFTAADANLDPLSLFGINFGTGKLGMPEIDFGGVFDNLGATAFSVPRGRTSQSYQILDNFTWLKGRHTFKFGGEYRRAAISSFNDNLERGGIVFGTGNGFDSNAGTDVLAAYFAGADSFTLADQGNTQRTTYNNGVSFFAQDDFRWTPRFTLNVGLRWEYFGPISEKNNLLANLGSDGNLAMAGSDGVKGAYSRDLNNFGPRIGFAWNVANATVIRGGYGVYYDYVPQDLMIANFTNDAGLVTPPIGPKPVTALTFNQTAFNTAPPANTPPAPVFTPSSAPPDIFFTPRNFVTPYVQNWNLNLQQELTRQIALQLGYVGSKGTKLVRLRDANQPDVNGNRANPNYGFMDEFANLSSSVYHALQATLRTRDWHGLSGFTGYTFSKSIDDASDGIDFVATVALPQDSNNLRAERGPSNFDTRHRFTAAFSYQVPHLFGPKQLAEGWQLNTVITAQSGRPIPLVSANDTSSFPNPNFNTQSNFHQRPNLVPGQPIINSNWESSPDGLGYLNGNAFAQPPDGTFGTLGRNAIYGPHFWNVDFALAKKIRFRESIDLQFRAELFNIFNHPNFALPGFSINPGSNDLITQTPDQAQTNPGLGGGGPRVVQLALKVIF